MSIDRKNGEPVTKEMLLEAIHNLTSVVGALEHTLTHDYPTRAEVRRRRWQVAGAMVVAIVSSYFFTVGTVSYCFLGGIPEPGTHNYCDIFPGYDESFDNNRRLQERFFEMEEFIEKNRQRITELETKGTGETPTE